MVSRLNRLWQTLYGCAYFRLHICISAMVLFLFDELKVIYDTDRRDTRIVWMRESKWVQECMRAKQGQTHRQTEWEEERRWNSTRKIKWCAEKVIHYTYIRWLPFPFISSACVRLSVRRTNCNGQLLARARRNHTLNDNNFRWFVLYFC